MKKIKEFIQDVSKGVLISFIVALFGAILGTGFGYGLTKTNGYSVLLDGKALIITSVDLSD